MSNRPEPIERHQFEIQQLVTEHPPRWNDRNKRIVFEIACPARSAHQGHLEYTRWAAMPLPGHVDTRSAISRLAHHPGYFEYTPPLERTGAVEWHVNFADPQLFGAYGSRLFAQDEMQVAEHPALGSLREALVARRLPAVTVEGGLPTPAIVMGALRHCRVATEPNAAEGRPHGLYGNAFARADPAAIQRATTRIDPPTTTNLIAMAAPTGGVGRYRINDIEYVLVTAFTAFRAAVFESARSSGPNCPVVVHTGFWGCGAFGGNRVLMTTLQILAAEMAGLERVVLHTGDASGVAAINDATRVFQSDLITGSPMDAHELIERVDAIGFEWGVSDGN